MTPKNFWRGSRHTANSTGKVLSHTDSGLSQLWPPGESVIYGHPFFPSSFTPRPALSSMPTTELKQLWSRSPVRSLLPNHIHYPHLSRPPGNMLNPNDNSLLEMRFLLASVTPPPSLIPTSGPLLLSPLPPLELGPWILSLASPLSLQWPLPVSCINGYCAPSRLTRSPLTCLLKVSQTSQT